jgi:glycine cleavage system H protein
MSNRIYSKEHEWVLVEGDIATIGISDHAQEQLGDIVYVELPEVGRTLAKGEEAATIESVKAASEIYAPLSGEVTEANEALGDDPSKVNSAAEGEGWFFKLKINDPGELEGMMDAAAYQSFLDSLD